MTEKQVLKIIKKKLAKEISMRKINHFILTCCFFSDTPTSSFILN